MRELQYPWVVAENIKKFQKTKQSDSDTSTDYLLDIRKIRGKLVDNNVFTNIVEETFIAAKDDISIKLVKLVQLVQEAIKRGKNGIVVVSNDLIELNNHLMGLCYVWSLTTNKSSGIFDTKSVCKLVKDSFTSFNAQDFEDLFLHYRATSLLVLEGFLPVDSKSHKDIAKEIEPLLIQRFKEVRGTFTIFTAQSNLNTETVGKDSAGIIGKVNDFTVRDYGNSISSLLRKNTEILIIPFETTKPIGHIMR